VAAAIAAADEAANAAGPLGKSPRRSAATDWDLQHTAFATTRLAGSATGSDEISRSFGVGVGSGDPVGARHALALGCDVALRVRACVPNAMRCWCSCPESGSVGFACTAAALLQPAFCADLQG